jgi:hypothetical protein
LGTPAYSPSPIPAADTRPSRATTPFAAEATRSRSPATRRIYSVAGLLAVSALIVGAALYFTRDPEPDPAVAAPVVAPQGSETRSSAVSELQVEEIPRGMSPGAATAPTAAGAGGAQNARALGSDHVPSASDVPPVLIQRPSAGSRREAGHRSTSTSQARKSVESDKDKHSEPARPAPSIADVPEPSPAAPSPRESRPSQQQRARSGTLNVNEF